MDRELSKEERNLLRRKKLMPYVIGIVAFAGLVVFLMFLLRQSVKRDNLFVATVDTGVIETSVSAS